jgi:hypothetical protein
VRLTQLAPQLLLHEGSSAASSGSDSKPAERPACPAVLLLGLDLAPAIGLHGPANFFGLADAQLLAETASAVARAQQQLTAAGCLWLPPIVSYSHYPFATVGGECHGGPQGSMCACVWLLFAPALLL